MTTPNQRKTIEIPVYKLGPDPSMHKALDMARQYCPYDTYHIMTGLYDVEAKKYVFTFRKK